MEPVVPSQAVSAVPFASRYFSKWLIVATLVWLCIYVTCFPDPVGLAARNWPMLVIGVIGAIIGNMTAIGGGIVFIPVLMFVYHTDPVSALKLSFVTQAVGMTSGATGWIQRGKVPIKLLKWTVPGLLAGTFLSTFVVHPHSMLVKAVFGPVSFLVGVLMLMFMSRVGRVEELPRSAMLPLALVSALGGTITGWVAIGEGEIIAAFCMLAYGLEANRGVGLGVVLLSINSIVLALIHALYFGGVPWIWRSLRCLRFYGAVVWARSSPAS